MNDPSPGPASIALNRFGLGARANEPPPRDAKGWLLDQFAQYSARPRAWQAQPDSAFLVSDYARRQREVQASTGEDRSTRQQALRRDTRDAYLGAVGARIACALDTPAPFVERMVHFWSNHFAVSVDKVAVTGVAGAFEAEAIRPHVLGRFQDMLLAVERHPAMLVFLDQVRSIGPGSLVAQRAARRNPDQPRGLNENLAREILELHTLGVRSGYTQDDVGELARALTGWSVGAVVPQAPGVIPGRFAFLPALHEPGGRQLMGRRYEQAGEGQADAILRDLSTSPATAMHLADKLARHVVADAPPPALVQRLTSVFMRSGGDLPSLYRALIEAPESWAAAPAKFKTPWEWSISAMRGLGWRDAPPERLTVLLNQLGQPVWRPGSPAGFDDTAASWAAPDALLRRVEFAQRLAAQAGDTLDARTLAPQLMAGAVSPSTTRAIARADSAPVAIALFLVSPEFQRR